MSFDGLLNATCTIKQAVHARDQASGWAETWEVVAENVPCRIWPLTANERVQAQAIGVDATFRAAMRPRELTEKNTLTSDGIEYDITGRLPRAGMSPHHIALGLLERRDGGR